MDQKKPLSSFWLIGWSFTLSLGWVIPNHYPPWAAFHVDVWIAVAIALASVGVIGRSRCAVSWYGLTFLTSLLVFLPGLQYAFGLIEFAGTAWISTLYLIGFLLALITGSLWESAAPGQVADGLFLAIGVASVISVGLQLHQWLMLDILDIWCMDPFGGPLFANFGQSNQLATLLLWGLLATVWGYIRRCIGGWTVVFISVYLLFGLTLTASRTAWLAIMIMVCATWIWRRIWAAKKLPWVATGLGLYFAVCLMSIGWIGQVLGAPLPADLSDFIRVGGQMRPAVWALFFDAAIQQPWFGYGWNQVGLAFLAVALDHPSLNLFFTHSHNLFLDLILWCGIPCGLLISMYLLWWLWLNLRAVRHAEDAVLLMVLLVVGNHAMLELPLHYAYFLLPAGLVMGSINTRLNRYSLFILGRWSAVAVWLLSVVLLILIVRDYTQVEPSYKDLRLELARIRYDKRGEPPEVLLLTQFDHLIKFSRFDPSVDMSVKDLAWMESVNNMYPTGFSVYKYASALAMNQRGQEAQLWLRKMCKIVPASECASVKVTWEFQSLSLPAIAAVPWPK